MAVTIRHVAEEAGVSPGTASRALRGHPQVSAECAARVRAVADRLGYNPLRDHSGRSRPEPLAGKRIDQLAVVAAATATLRAGLGAEAAAGLSAA
jgi:DNA-binding LacI/PurR family transcriptional regulator